MIKPDFKRAPWTHPAVWKAHVVRMSRAYPDGVAVSVAACECGWAVWSRESHAGHIAQTRAINDHWHSVIAEAEQVPA